MNVKRKYYQKAILLVLVVSLFAGAITLATAKPKKRYTWTYTTHYLGFGGEWEPLEYDFRRYDVDGIYVKCTSVIPMTNYVDVTFTWGSGSSGPHRITQGGQTPTVTDIDDEDVLITIAGVNQSAENSYDTVCRIYVGRD